MYSRSLMMQLLVHLRYYDRRLTRITNAAIFYIQKLMEAVLKSIRGPQRMLVNYGPLNLRTIVIKFMTHFGFLFADEAFSSISFSSPASVK